MGQIRIKVYGISSFQEILFIDDVEPQLTTQYIDEFDASVLMGLHFRDR